MKPAPVLSIVCLMVLLAPIVWAEEETPGDRPAPVAVPTDADSAAVGEEPAPVAQVDDNESLLTPAFPQSTSIEIPEAWLLGVRDLTRGISETEREPYYHILAHARQFDLSRLNAAGRADSEQALSAYQSDPKNKNRSFSLFADIVRRPDHYRGKPIQLRGYLQRLETIDAGENDEGLTTLHQGYLFTGDSLQSPYVVVSSEMTPDIPRPTKGHPTNDVVVTGYFFKLWSYEAERGQWAAPLILAKTIEWHPRPPALSERAEFKVALGVGLALLAATLVAVLVKQRRDDRRFRAAQAARQGTTTAQDLAALKQLEQDR